ncbi:hypothetical protein SynBIOSU31_02212 [Synechococcus sp. BIOS-U3-1]|uniref:hypothetical protein n=1 Tax=Synechococcus sp. BIOS-U3-1 TaxID=1400865 RepID=UPI001645F6A3|nr:hypothetical protein [Synechococcus sp. BIOS-U3-1]QNI59078.1 hypothetical protein SynBIOSU31_02212 [Synechococcus sp. BIOS-U3-1]
MTTFNTDYNNTELLDQELTIDQLECVAGGNFGQDAARFMYENVRNNSPTLRIFEWLNGGRGPLA